jgi:hypothetical protein
MRLPRHPAVAYLFLVKRMVTCAPRSSPVIALVLACFAIANPAQGSTIRCDGVYRAPVQPPARWPVKPTKELFLYFRFYPDGSVVSLLSTGTPMEVAKFIRRNLDGSGNGTYSISGDRLHFRVTTRHGSIIYSGKVHGDSLALRTYGSISVPLYQFAPVPFAK